jgi:adenosylmethionine-8-amino-7-oxononanoate aminotransferase
MTPTTVAERDRRHVWHTWTPVGEDRTELMFDHGQGYRVRDVDGREYLEACALNSTCGYAHPRIVRAIAEQAARLHYTDLSLGSHPLAGELAERIGGYLPGHPSRTLLVNSGSEGIDAAVMIALAVASFRGRPSRRIIAFRRAYHGSTLLSRSLSRLPRNVHDWGDPVPITLVDLPVPAEQVRRPGNLGRLLAAFERAIGDSEPPAAVVVEPFLNVGGGVELPAGFLVGLRRLCDEYGTLLVVDEVLTGYGRTGRMFALEHENVRADVVVSSKGLAGGYMPIAAVTVGEELFASFRADPVMGGLRYGHTTSGHAVGCAAALATLDVIEDEGLIERSARFGKQLLARLEPLTAVEGVVDVRGFGLMVTIDLVDEQRAAAVRRRALDLGVLVRKPGTAVMVVPPLIVDEPGLADIMDRVTQAVHDAAA